MPEHDGVLSSVFIDGDQLTCERIRGAKKACCQATTSVERFDGLTEKVEDWHALQAYYQVRMHIHAYIPPFALVCLHAN